MRSFPKIRQLDTNPNPDMSSERLQSLQMGEKRRSESNPRIYYDSENNPNPASVSSSREEQQQHRKPTPLPATNSSNSLMQDFHDPIFRTVHHERNLLSARSGKQRYTSRYARVTKDGSTSSSSSHFERGGDGASFRSNSFRSSPSSAKISMTVSEPPAGHAVVVSSTSSLQHQRTPSRSGSRRELRQVRSEDWCDEEHSSLKPPCRPHSRSNSRERLDESNSSSTLDYDTLNHSHDEDGLDSSLSSRCGIAIGIPIKAESLSSNDTGKQQAISSTAYTQTTTTTPTEHHGRPYVGGLNIQERRAKRDLAQERIMKHLRSATNVSLPSSGNTTRPTSNSAARDSLEDKDAQQKRGTAAIATRPGAVELRQAPMRTKTLEHYGKQQGPTVSAATCKRAASSRRNAKEAFKLLDQECGLSLASLSDEEDLPGAFAIARREYSKEIMKKRSADTGPRLAFAFDPNDENDLYASTSQLDHNLDNKDDYEDEESGYDLEAQAGIPVSVPGAFAVEGYEARQRNAAAATAAAGAVGSRHALGENNFANDQSEPQEQRQPPEAPEAEVTPADEYLHVDAVLHEHVVVDGAVVNNEEEDALVNPKAVRRLRMVQFMVLCFSLAALLMVLFTVLGTFSDDSTVQTVPMVNGWMQIGSDLYGVTEEPQSAFGSKSVISGDGRFLAIAAPGTDNGTALNVGEVRIFQSVREANGTDWKLDGIVTGPGPSTDAEMALSISQDGLRVAVGFPQYGGGRVDVYERQSIGWTIVFSVSNPPKSDDIESEWFGRAISLSADGSILAVGAPLKDTFFGTRAGLVRVYRQMGSSRWLQLGDDIVGESKDEFFGWSLSIRPIDGFRVAIGCPIKNVETGAVRVYDWNGEVWKQMGQELAEGSALSRFGESITMSTDGTVLAVGEPGNPFESGIVYIFREENGKWGPNPDTIKGSETGEGLGSSVALSSDGVSLVVGAPQSSLFGSLSGRVQVYRYDGKGKKWSQQGSDIGKPDATQFGASVGISSYGDRFVVGAPATTFDGSVGQAGSAHVFDDIVLKS